MFDPHAVALCALLALREQAVPLLPRFIPGQQNSTSKEEGQLGREGMEFIKFKEKVSYIL